jgi:hypothetical protein
MSQPNPNDSTGEPEYQWGPDGPPGAPAPGTPPYGHPAAGYGYPQHPPYYQPTMAAGVPVPAVPPPGFGPPMVPMVPGALLTVGDITVLPDSILTPSGTMPLKGAVWHVSDLSRSDEQIPPYAIVLAVVFFVVCFLGLLFLLIKERKTTGLIQVTVSSGGRQHTTMIPAQSPLTIHQVMGQINYARSLSG